MRLSVVDGEARLVGHLDSWGGGRGSSLLGEVLFDHLLLVVLIDEFVFVADRHLRYAQARPQAYQSGRLSVYMEDMVRRLERLQKGESEEEEKSTWFTRRKQEIWDRQYLHHHEHLKSGRVTTRSGSSLSLIHI